MRIELLGEVEHEVVDAELLRHTPRVVLARYETALAVPRAAVAALSEPGSAPNPAPATNLAPDTGGAQS